MAEHDLSKKEQEQVHHAVLQFLSERKDDPTMPSTQQISAGTGLEIAVVQQALKELNELGMVVYRGGVS